MKILFAVNDEKSSAAIVKKYQKEYKEIISYKNVYYFNAILKELQRDKNYDRIVISEDLEEFSSTSYEQQDRYIFERLDNISDEASNSRGNNIPIILLCAERRVKSEEILVKLFGIGIYDAIIGNDRSIDQVCRLINKPRTKKEAKLYYKIDAEDVNYQTESENEVSEDEMQNILNHFSRLGKNEDRYVESFNNIVSQYNEQQLKTIIAVLPTNVKAILETNSIEYQKLVMSGKASKVKRIANTPKSGPSEKLINLESKTIDVKNNPVIVPTSLSKNIITKAANKNNFQSLKDLDDEFDDIDEDVEDNIDNENDFEQNDRLDFVEEDNEEQKNIPEEFENDDQEEEIEEKTVKRGRGRPRKNPIPSPEEMKPKKRGRPRKVVDDIDNISLPGFEKKNEETNKIEDDILPGFEDESSEEDTILPGFEDIDDNDNNVLPGVESAREDDAEDEMLPGFEQDEENEDFLPGFEEDNSFKKENRQPVSQVSQYKQEENRNTKGFSRKEPKREYIEGIDIGRLLTEKNKIAAFVGASKNGVSFTVNNIAEYLSEYGVDVAILDATQNKNSYYIYTQNEDDLRSRAAYSITNLLNGDARGIKVKEDLTVYTTVPNQDDNIENYGKILETLVKNHSVILIDCDFNTPFGYFENAQEIYLVQSMDILTIQPLTAFLRELKSKNILTDEKIKIIVNKVVRLKKITSKNIIGGMAYYNDPEMSFMTELFNKDTVQYQEVPFYQDIYEKYLDGVVDCDISIRKYSKDFMVILKNLASMVYPQIMRQPKSGYSGYNYNKNKKSNTQYSNGFSNSVNNTLNNMKKKY